MTANDQRTIPASLNQTQHERLVRPEIVRMDYGMTGDALRLRAAVADYMLRHWSVDCSPDHHLSDEPCRLWLADPLVLYGVESAALAPGYQSPQHNKETP